MAKKLNCQSRWSVLLARNKKVEDKPSSGINRFVRTGSIKSVGQLEGCSRREPDSSNCEDFSCKRVRATSICSGRLGVAHQETGSHDEHNDDCQSCRYANEHLPDYLDEPRPGLSLGIQRVIIIVIRL